MRWGCLFALLLVGGVGGWLIFALGKMVQGDPPNSMLPALVRDTPTNKFGTNNADPVFRRRVAAMFPVGSSAQNMVLELKREGFIFHTKNGETTASFTQWGIFRRDWWITWRNDDKGQIRVINVFENWAGL